MPARRVRQSFLMGVNAGVVSALPAGGALRLMLPRARRAS
jgi:hypothetical protein